MKKKRRSEYNFSGDICQSKIARDWVNSLPRDQFVDLARFLRQQHDRDKVYEQRTTSAGLGDNVPTDDAMSTASYLDDLCLDDMHKSVAHMLLQGYQRNEIADTLGLSVSTVYRYVDDIGNNALAYRSE